MFYFLNGYRTGRTQLKTCKNVQLGLINQTGLQVTNKNNLLNSSHHVLDVYDDSLAQTYPMHATHDIIPEGRKVNK